MATYFFDTMINGDAARDTDGVDLADGAAARREAVATLCGLAMDAEPQMEEFHIVVDVLDADRVNVLSLELRLHAR